MVSFFVCLAILIIGYFTYGRVIEHIYGPDDRETAHLQAHSGDRQYSSGSRSVPF